MEGTIHQRITEALTPTELAVETVSASEGKYSVRIVSPAFTGVPLLERHRKVNSLFEKELLSGEIHALTITAKPPPPPAAAA